MNKITIHSPRIWDTNYAISPNGYKEDFITNEYKINPDKKIITLEGLTCGVELYQKMKRLWQTTDMIYYSFPMVMITSNFFKMNDSWTLHGIQHMVDSGWIDGDSRYLLFRGIGVPMLPCYHRMAGKDPLIRYKKSRTGCLYAFRNSWSRPQALRFDKDEMELILCIDDQEYDVCEALGYNHLPVPVIYVPWPFYLDYLVDAPWIDNAFQLDDRLFEI